MSHKNRQMVLIKTDRHDVSGEPDQQWIGRAGACGLLLCQELIDMPEKNELEKKLVEILVEQCHYWRWSKWDHRSTWYLESVAAPVSYDPVTHQRTQSND